MRKFNICLVQSSSNGFGLCKKMEVYFNSNKEAIHYTVDKLLESPKKYVKGVLFDTKDNLLIKIER